MHAAGKTNWRHLREKTLMRHACAPSRAPPQPPPPPRVYSKYWDFKKGKCEIWSGETRRETGHLKQRRVRLVNKKLIQSPRRSDALSPTYREKENAGSEKRWRAGVRVEGVLLEELGKDFFFYFFFFLCSSRLSLRAATIPDVAHTPQSASVSAWEHRPAGPARHQRPDPALSLSLSLFPPFFYARLLLAVLTSHLDCTRGHMVVKSVRYCLKKCDLLKNQLHTKMTPQARVQWGRVESLSQDSRVLLHRWLYFLILPFTVRCVFYLLISLQPHLKP